MVLKKYSEFIKKFDSKINSEDFKSNLIKMQNLDLKHFNKIISIEKINEIIKKYRDKKEITSSYKKVSIVLNGNPEIVLMTCLDAIRTNTKLIMIINDFCLAQNTLIVELINSILENFIELKNLCNDEEIIEISKKVDKTICIGNTNVFYNFEDQIENIEIYPYNIIEIFYESDKYRELLDIICNYASSNQYEIDIYEDMNLENCVKAINRDGMKFGSLLLSENNDSTKYFMDNINNKSFINENPFGKIEFDLSLYL